MSRPALTKARVDHSCMRHCSASGAVIFLMICCRVPCELATSIGCPVAQMRPPAPAATCGAGRFLTASYAAQVRMWIIGTPSLYSKARPRAQRWTPPTPP